MDLFGALRAASIRGQDLAKVTIPIRPVADPVYFNVPEGVEPHLRWMVDAPPAPYFPIGRVELLDPEGRSAFHFFLDEGEGEALLPAKAGRWQARLAWWTDNSSLGTGEVLLDIGAAAIPPLPEVSDFGHATEPAVVVAIVDTGINPYHEAFRRPYVAPGSLRVEARDDLTKRAALWLPVASAENYTAALAADKNLWLRVQNRTLYRFAGTALYGISFLEEDGTPRVLDYYGHGTWVAGRILAANPEAVIVSVQVTAASLDEGIMWAARQPWIDVISVSWGALANLPFDWALWRTGAERYYPTASLHAARTGKLVFNSAGNEPTPTVTDSLDGPPWVISVGGADETWRGETGYASKLVDFVSNATVYVPDHETLDGYKWVQGTSFASPTAAGEASRLILELRRAAGHLGGIRDGLLIEAGGWRLGAGEIREILNMSAVYWAAWQYDPTRSAQSTNETVERAVGPPLPVLVPWAQMGWGYLGPGVSDRALGWLLNGTELPPKPPEAKAFMAARQAAREKLWQP